MRHHCPYDIQISQPTIHHIWILIWFSIIGITQYFPRKYNCYIQAYTFIDKVYLRKIPQNNKLIRIPKIKCVMKLYFIIFTFSESNKLLNNGGLSFNVFYHFSIFTSIHPHYQMSFLLIVTIFMGKADRFSINGNTKFWWKYRGH